MDGYELAKRIRQMDQFHPYLVALTGYGQEEDRRRALEAGFDCHLVKPTSVEALHHLLTALPDRINGMPGVPPEAGGSTHRPA